MLGAFHTRGIPKIFGIRRAKRGLILPRYGLDIVAFENEPYTPTTVHQSYTQAHTHQNHSRKQQLHHTTWASDWCRHTIHLSTTAAQLRGVHTQKIEQIQKRHYSTYFGGSRYAFRLLLRVGKESRGGIPRQT